MKNMKKIILSLSLVGAFTLCEQEPKKVAFNINNIVATVQTKSKELVDTAETAGRYVDNGLMAFPYYIGAFFRGGVLTGKTMADYIVKVPFRWVGNGIDGLFGQGTVDKMGSVTKGVAALGVGGLVTACAYKGLNGLAKKLLISDIKTVFEQGGTKNALGVIEKYTYDNSQYSDIGTYQFYNRLLYNLSERFKKIDLYEYIKCYSIDIKTVLNEVDRLTSGVLSNDQAFKVEDIVNGARKSANGYLLGLGKIHLFNGYVQEALELYVKILLASKIANCGVVTHEEVLKRVNSNQISKAVLEGLKGFSMHNA